jgi:hypothetical protein
MSSMASPGEGGINATKEGKRGKEEIKMRERQWSMGLTQGT